MVQPLHPPTYRDALEDSIFRDAISELYEIRPQQQTIAGKQETLKGLIGLLISASEDGRLVAIDDVGPEAVHTLQEVIEAGDWRQDSSLVVQFLQTYCEILGIEYEQPDETVSVSAELLYESPRQT